MRRHHHDEPADYDAHGGQPGPHETGVLTSSVRHVDALDRAERARDALLTEPTPDTVFPLTHTEADANETFATETFALQPGDSVEVAGRDALRASIEVNNLSAHAVALCSTKGDADAGLRKFPPARSIALPPGGTVPRKMTHKAAVFVVVDPAAGATCVVDVIVERHRSPRP